MEFKGTKGKWEYSGGDNSSIDIVLDNNSTISIDRFDRYGNGLVGSREEMEANAKLISKAPEMLEMLNNIVNILDVKCNKGRNDNSWKDFQNGDGEDIGVEIDIFIKEAKNLVKETTTL